MFHNHRSLFCAVLQKLFIVICVTLNSVSGKMFLFVGVLFFGECGVLFNVLSRSLFSFFRRGSLDKTVLRSVNFGVFVLRVLSLSCFVYSIVIYAERRHTQFLCSHAEFYIWLPRDRASWCILIMKANKMHYFPNLFEKVLYTFRTGALSIIRSISTLYTQAICICRASSLDIC